MTSYKEILNDKIYVYFYDRSIRLWTIFEMDAEGNQICDEADHFHDKGQMLEVYDFKFKKEKL